MENISKTKMEFLRECYDDYVGLWSLIRRIKFLTKNEDPKSVRGMTISLLAELFSQGLIKPGIPRISGEFEEWKLSTEKTIERIQIEWDKLGVEPNMGDIVWFTTTEKGDRMIEENLSSMG